MRYILLLIMIAGPAWAQQTARGTFQYQVDGIYEGHAMEPWSTTTTVFDTTSALGIRHVVHRGGGTRFEYLFVGRREASWINEGRGGTNTCRATLSDEVADFALPYIISGMAPGEGELTMVSCAAGGETQRKKVKFTISATDSGWSAKGSSDYPFELTISAQRKVVKYVQPQGNVGYAIYSLR